MKHYKSIEDIPKEFAVGRMPFGTWEQVGTVVMEDQEVLFEVLFKPSLDLGAAVRKSVCIGRGPVRAAVYRRKK